jgi:NAD(P)-dependent dehydrogenase (short-subunit alcohol dehydrogenase family)
MTLTLHAQRVLVVGGTGRMGLATALTAQARGASVTVASRRPAEALPKGLATISFDSADLASASKALTHAPPFDHVIVAVSANASAAGIDSTSTVEVQNAFARYWASYNILHLSPRILSRNGSIVLVSGSSGRRPVRGYGVWTALHGAIEALARAAAIDLAPLRVNVVSPGGIEMQPDRQLVEHRGTAADVAAMIVALLENSAVTGTVVDVDGGERLGSWPSSSPAR